MNTAGRRQRVIKTSIFLDDKEDSRTKSGVLADGGACNENARKQSWSQIEAGIELLVASDLPIKYIRESIDEIER